MTTSGKITFTDWREDYAYILGVQAYIFSYPWVYMSEIRYAWITRPANPTQMSAADNRFWHARNLMTPEYQDGRAPNNQGRHL